MPALYGTLAERGFFPSERLSRHLDTSDSIYWHPNRNVPGIEFHSGSLGHLLSVGVGIAMDIKMSGGKARVFVVLGDGELDEGSVWEALLVASAKRLDNLVLVSIGTSSRRTCRTEELIPLEPLAAKLEAFGAAVTTIDGHDFDEMETAFASLPHEILRPTAIIAQTVRGKGLASLERRADRWFVALTDAEVDALLAELRGGAQRGADLRDEGGALMPSYEDTPRDARRAATGGSS